MLANENRGKRGDAIVQAGAFDDGKAPADGVGKLANFVRVKKTGANLVDCALGELDAGIAHDAAQLRDSGALAGLGDAFLDEGTEVTKLGRTTGLTRAYLETLVAKRDDAEKFAELARKSGMEPPTDDWCAKAWDSLKAAGALRSTSTT